MVIEMITVWSLTVKIQIFFPGNCDFHASGVKTISKCGKFNPSVDSTIKKPALYLIFQSGISYLGNHDFLSWKFQLP